MSAATTSSPVVSPISKENAAPSVKPIYDKFTHVFGHMPSFFGTMARVPEALEHFVPLYGAVIDKGSVQSKYKELAYLKTAQINGCEYCFKAHSASGKKNGVSEDQIGQMLVRVATRLNDQELTTYTADGVLVATPTGSTAYSHAAGGPILHPEVHSLILTPICAHPTTSGSIVVPANTVVELTARTDHEAALMADDPRGRPVQSLDRVDADVDPEGREGRVVGERHRRHRADTAADLASEHEARHPRGFHAFCLPGTAGFPPS